MGNLKYEVKNGNIIRSAVSSHYSFKNQILKFSGDSKTQKVYQYTNFTFGKLFMLENFKQFFKWLLSTHRFSQGISLTFYPTPFWTLFSVHAFLPHSHSSEVRFLPSHWTPRATSYTQRLLSFPISMFFAISPFVASYIACFLFPFIMHLFLMF